MLKEFTQYVLDLARPGLVSCYTGQSEKEVCGLSLDTLLHTITAGGNRFGLVAAF